MFICQFRFQYFNFQNEIFREIINLLNYYLLPIIEIIIIILIIYIVEILFIDIIKTAKLDTHNLVDIRSVFWFLNEWFFLWILFWNLMRWKNGLAVVGNAQKYNIMS